VSAIEPGGTAAPPTVAAAAALLGAAGPPVVFEGGGTKPCPPHNSSPASATISTRLLTGIVLHDPLDGVAIVRAGTPLAELQAELTPHGQWLAVDPPFVADGATVGGIFSANDAGPRRLAYGTLRDLVIGATVVTGDGIVAHSGGRVIKNVAGFDIARLYCGAFGTLGLVAELAVRLHPLRRASRTVTVGCTPDRLLELTHAIRISGLTPTAVDWRFDGLRLLGALIIRFEERTERATTAQSRDLLGLCELRHFDATVLDGDDEQAVWAEVDGLLAGTSSDTVVRAVTRPSRVVEAAERLHELANGAAVECGFVSHALVGVHTARLRGVGHEGPEGHAKVVLAWRSAVERLGGHVTVRRFAAGPADTVDRWGAPRDGLELMRRVKQELDPHNRCAPGCFVGGI